MAFRTSGTLMESRVLVAADTAEEAKRLALEDWNEPFVSPVDGEVYPVDDYDEIVVEPHPVQGPILLRWEEPR